MKKGDKVRYSPGYGREEKGIIKNTTDNPSYFFVVYNCSGNWDNYENYTGVRTFIGDLKEGWEDNTDRI